MQTRLPARLAAPKLLSLAHVISLEQSGEERRGEKGGREKKEEEEGKRLEAWRWVSGC